MGTRKPRVFVASPFLGLEDERAALLIVLESHVDKIDIWSYEAWKAGGGAPDDVSVIKASQADYFILILGGRYGSRSVHTGIGITESEYDAFLYTHPAQCCSEDKPVLFVFEKRSSEIAPRDYDLDSTSIDTFRAKVKRRSTLPVPFTDWQHLQRQVNDIVARLPRSVPDREYRKVSIEGFDYRLMRAHNWKDQDIETRWSKCPCTVFEAGGCEYQEVLHYRPPATLRAEMERHLGELWNKPETDLRWKECQPSFKTVRISERTADRGSRLVLEFCHSTWHQFLGTNLAASKEWETAIRRSLAEAPKKGCDLAHSPFSNNLGFAVAMIHSPTETIYYVRRGLVAVHAGKKSTAVGSQLHAYDRRHLTPDGLPDVFRAVYTELWNETRIRKSDIKNLWLEAWGVETRTGVPDLLFVCDSRRPLHDIEKDVCEARVNHSYEFDQRKMRFEARNIVLDYQLLADLSEHPDDWEPEAAVAHCFALQRLAPNSVKI